MALKSANNPQDILIESLDGIYLVDAGAGTGKTYSIVRRYGNLLDKKVKPEEILLITFSRNAAEQMKDEVITNLSGKISISRLLEAPIMTFHSFCSKVIKSAGTDSPLTMGINENISGNFDILEEKTIERELFRRFYFTFRKNNSKGFEEIFQSLENKIDDVLSMIKKLCSKGIFPGKKSWNESDLASLTGNFERFSEEFDRLNAPKPGKKKDVVNNDISISFKKLIREKLYLEIDESKIFNEHVLNPDSKEYIFFDDSQKNFIEFFRRVYISYIEFLLKKNMLNYEFLVMFAYISILKNQNFRKKIQYRYVMIDEFQDTDEIQFKLIMLLCKNIYDTANLCVVGDWKQGIYGFRNTNIKNITDFSENLTAYKNELNSTEKIIEYDVTKHKRIIFENNYRSSELILNFSKDTLLIKATKNEEPDSEFVNKFFENPLLPIRELDDMTEINFYEAEDKSSEYNLLIQKISELVNENKKYKIREFDKDGNSIERNVRYSDICVLSRNRNFCLEFQREALKQDIPVNYSGGMEIFLSEQGILVNAWLKLLLNDRDISGWLPVLDKEGYAYSEINKFAEILVKESSGNTLYNSYPDEKLGNFLNHLKNNSSDIQFAAGTVLNRYGFDDAVSIKITEVISNWINSGLTSLSDIVRLIDNSSDDEFSIDYGDISDAVLTQTIHKSKGLEYPVVIIANMNVKVFPDTKGEQGVISFVDNAGLRLKTQFGFNGKYYYKFSNWHTDFTNAVLKQKDYDEERRLLYVAVTRAKQYLFFTSYSPSIFFTELSEKSGIRAENDFSYGVLPVKTAKISEAISIPKPHKKENQVKLVSVHSLMEKHEQDIAESFKSGNDFEFRKSSGSAEKGILIHRLAQKLAAGIEIESKLPEVNKIKKFLQGLNSSTLMSEVNIIYPKDNEVIRGTIDLLAFYEDKIVIYDYKTDESKNNLPKYKIQMNFYKECLQQIYADKPVECKIYFLTLDEFVDV